LLMMKGAIERDGLTKAAVLPALVVGAIAAATTVA